MNVRSSETLAWDTFAAKQMSDRSSIGFLSLAACISVSYPSVQCWCLKINQKTHYPYFVYKRWRLMLACACMISYFLFVFHSKPKLSKHWKYFFTYKLLFCGFLVDLDWCEQNVSMTLQRFFFFDNSNSTKVSLTFKTWIYCTICKLHG